jgi:hypothetical protein
MRARRVPLIRIGLTLVVGAALASLITFYVSVGASMADMNGEAVSTQPRELLTHFSRNFLFAGAVPGVIFYGGVAFMLLGIVRNFSGSKRRAKNLKGSDRRHESMES